jgi:hypothetical protein
MNTLTDCATARLGDKAWPASTAMQPALAAPGQVRAFTRQSRYQRGQDEQLTGAAVRIVREPVTDAVRHGAPPPPPGRRRERIRLWLITLTLTPCPGALRSQARGGPGFLPVQRPAGRKDGCGRGLVIIDALAGCRTPGRGPRGGNRVRPCMSGAGSLLDEGR